MPRARGGGVGKLVAAKSGEMPALGERVDDRGESADGLEATHVD